MTSYARKSSSAGATRSPPGVEPAHPERAEAGVDLGVSLDESYDELSTPVLEHVGSCLHADQPAGEGEPQGADAWHTDPDDGGLGLIDGGTIYPVEVLDRVGGRVFVLVEGEEQPTWVHSARLAPMTFGQSSSHDSPPDLGNANRAHRVELLVDLYAGDPDGLLLVLRADPSLWGAQVPMEQATQLGLIAAIAPAAVWQELSRELPPHLSGTRYLDAVELDKNPAGNVTPGVALGPMVAGFGGHAGALGVSYVEGYVEGLSSKLDAETVQQVVAALKSGVSLSAVFPVIGVVGAVQGAVDELAGIAQLVMHLPETLAALDELAQQLLSANGGDVAYALGVTSGQGAGADVASVATMNAAQASWWIGHKLGPMLLDVVVSIVTAGAMAALPGALKGVRALAEGLDTMKTLRRLVDEAADAMGPAHRLAGGPDGIPDRASRGEFGPRDPEHLAQMQEGMSPQRWHEGAPGHADSPDPDFGVPLLDPARKGRGVMGRLPRDATPMQLVEAMPLDARTAFSHFLGMGATMKPPISFQRVLDRAGVVRAERPELGADAFWATVKGSFDDEIVDQLTDTTQDGMHGALRRLRERTSQLNSNDKGRIHVKWDQRMNAPNARMEVPVGQEKLARQQGIDVGTDRRLDALDPSAELAVADVADWLRSEGYSDDVIKGLGERLELGSIREVKGGGLGADDIKRLEAYLRLVDNDPPAIVDGMRVEKLVLVLNDPKKALSAPGVRGRLKDLLGDTPGLQVETYDASGGRVAFGQGNAADIDLFFEGLK